MKRYTWLCCLLLCGCTWDKLADKDHGYPESVAEITRFRCATSGCHTTQSAEAAAGLNLETWESLFKGSRGGSAVIPYAPNQSYLLYSVNTDTSRGVTFNPTMPIGGLTLNASEYAMLKQWIADGARNLKGEERFPPIANRRKWYIANQGCDLVAVVDAETRQIMRYIQVGAIDGTSESPHNVKISKDGKFWYTIFLFQNNFIEKYSTLTDEKVGQIEIGDGDWNTFTISTDGKFGIVVSYVQPGNIDVVLVDLEQDVMTEAINLGGQVHGSAPHPTLRRFYLTKQDESSLIMLDYDAQGHNPSVEPIDLLQGVPAHNGATQLRPHEVIFAPDGAKYFVTCQSAREVRVYESLNNTLLQVILVGDDPVEFALSPTTGHLYVTCMEDVTTFPANPNQHGSVAIIDYNTNALVKSIYTGYQPHGIALDEVSGLMVVTNRNVNVNGPAPHHTSSCGGRNGYLTAIDIQTLQLLPGFKPELSSDPYSVAVKR
jgi:DNA-binding beta-propeller fold protein YncE